MEKIAPEYLLNAYTLKAIWPPIALGVLLAVAAAGLAKIFRLEFGRTILGSFVMSLAGVLTGEFTSLSREPAVTALIPAIMTLFGGLAGCSCLAIAKSRGPLWARQS